MKKILLINPSYRNDVLENVKILGLPPINLAILARITPEEYEVSILDEHREVIDFNQPADLVALTCMTPLAPRAYEISSEFRKRGIPVVMGGIHPSMMSKEAEQYVDSVVTGEGEEVWMTILKDFEKNSLKKTYTASRPALEDQPVPRRDLISKGYFIQTVQTSRGCPYDCNFCSVTQFNGGKYRFRKVEDVMKEIKQIKENRFFFIDDNLIGSGEKCTKHAFQLFERLKELKKDWASQTCITVADDAVLLKKAAEAGARFFFIGFESVEKDTLLFMNKKVNIRSKPGYLEDAIKKIHDSGISIVGGFIFGSDTDTKSVFDKTVEFVDRNNLDAAQLTIQTPFPGTNLYRQLVKENRLLYKNYPDDWKRYNGFEVVFKPKNMTVDELREGHLNAYKESASLARAIKKAVNTFFITGNLLGTMGPFFWNYDCFKTMKKKKKLGYPGSGSFFPQSPVN